MSWHPQLMAVSTHRRNWCFHRWLLMGLRETSHLTGLVQLKQRMVLDCKQKEGLSVGVTIIESRFSMTVGIESCSCSRR